MKNDSVQRAKRCLWPLLAAALPWASAGAASPTATALPGAASPAGAASASAAASSPAGSAAPGAGATDRAQGRWSFRIDDDGLAFRHNDRDYTGGLVFTLSGAAARRAWNPAGALRWLDDKLGVASLTKRIATRRPAVEIGIQLFTPQNLRRRDAIHDDRPYASLVYLATSQLSHAPAARRAYQSTLTFGVLGLPLAGQIQRAIHDLVNYTPPMGYAHQISAGGEPTLRYTFARYGLLSAGELGKHRYALRFDAAASAGYITEADAGLALHWGSLASAWWASTPQLGDYAGQPVVTPPSAAAQPGGRRFEISAGVQLRMRFYNAFLQGQFRHSDVAYASSQLEHRLHEAWIGATIAFKHGLTFSYMLRRQSKELKTGLDAHGFTWAGFAVTRTF